MGTHSSILAYGHEEPGWLQSRVAKSHTRLTRHSMLLLLLSRFRRIRLCATPWTVACQAPLSWDPPGKNIGVGSHSLLQGIFPTQGSNPLLLCLLHWHERVLPR